jgi:predicted PurR-regulated permease PerM
VLLAVAGLQVALWLFAGLADLLGLVFVAWLLSISMEPVVGALHRRGLPRGWATASVMSGAIAFLVAFLAVFGALLVDQLGQLVTALPDVVDDVVVLVNDRFGTSFRAGDISDSLQLTPERTQDLARELAPGVAGVISSLFGLLLQGFALALFVFYMSAQAPQLRRTVSSWFPPRQQAVVSTVWEIAVDKTGRYVVSRVVLALLSAFCTGIFLWLLGVPFWLPLAIWTGFVSQFVPTVGTYIAIAVPALIALADQPADAVWVVLFGVAYQQVENYLLSPRITARALAVHPAVGLGSVLAGAALFGPVGAMVSVPVVAALQALAETYGRRYELVTPGTGDPGAPAGPGRPVG